MIRLIIMVLVAAFLQSCGVNRQTAQIKALENCDYRISSADSMYLAGMDVARVIEDENLDLNKIPVFALAYLRRDIPFQARINLDIENPTADLAAINQFDYILLVKNQQIAEGSMNQPVRVEPGATVRVPIKLNSNIYPLLSRGSVMADILEFLRAGASGAPEKKGIVTLKIKPSIQIGNRLVKYPGYITIDKEISSRIFF